MEAEIKSRLESERKAVAEAEARAKAAEAAIAEARQMAEEAARAKAAAEARVANQVADPEAVAKAEAAMKALEEAKARARAEAEARIAAEARAKSEAEARQREEEQRKIADEATNKARAEADARSKAELKALQDQARQASKEAESRAEHERLAREEMEGKIAAERRAREEAEAKVTAERELREEAIRKVKVEAEAKARAEVDAAIEIERKKRIEAETKAAAEIAARSVAERKAREEAERQLEIAQRAREDAERLAREASSGESAQARQAREDAEVRAKMAEAAVAKAQAQAETERQARAQAEERAKTEAVARVMRENELRESAEKNVKSLVEEELRARAKAEIEADARYRAEAEERAKAAAADRKLRMESEARDAASSFRSDTKPKSKGVLAAVILFALLACGLGALQLMPMVGYIPGVQQIISQRFNQPVHISNMRYTVYPEQVLRLEKVSIGGVQQIKADMVTIPMMPWTLLSGGTEFDSITANAVVLEPSAIDLLPAMTKAGGGNALKLRDLRITGIKVGGIPFDVPMFDAQISFAADGTVQKFRLNDGKITVNATPKDGGLALGIEAREWQPPFGPGLQFTDLAISAQLSRQQATLSSIEGRLGGGRLKGAAKANWGSDIRVEGEFKLENAKLQQLLPGYTRDFSATGNLTTNGSFALQGKSLKTLFDASEAEANFTVETGELINVDVVRAIQSPAAGGTRGGKTKFDTLTGSVSINTGRYSYKQLQMTSGPLNANGAINVGGDGSIAGRLNAELGSKGLVVARGSLGITGSIRDPLLRP